MEHVTINDPPTMNLLGLLLANIIQRNLSDEAKLRRFQKLSGDLEVHAGEMCVTLTFADGKMTVFRGPADKPKAVVSGAMDSLLGLALGGGMVLPWLAGRIKTRGNLLMLLALKPLLATE